MGTISPSTPQTILNTDTKQFTANPNDNYEFVNWTHSDGVVVANSASANTNVAATKSGTLTANFRSTATYSLLVQAGNNISKVSGSTDPITLGESYEIKATPAYGYRFNQWTADPAENATFIDAASATTDVTVLNGSVTVTASATEILAMLTTNNSFDAGTPTLAIPTTTAEKIGVATTAKITATEAPSGYTFVGWTLTNCERTDGGADNATSITVRSNGDSKAATVVANYAEDLTTSWVLKGSFVDDFATAYDFTKKSGESTGKVAYVSIDLDAHKEYQFKVVENGSTWYGNNNSDEEWWIKQTAEDWSFFSDAGNCHMKTGLAGTYTFKIDYSGTNLKVSIYFPEIYAVVGTFNEWKEDANKLTFDGNIGTTTINLEASAKNYEFKVIDNAVHGGIVNKTITQTATDLAITVGGGDNIKLTANANPKGDYIFTYDKSTKKLSVTYPTVYTIKVEAENGTVEGAGTYVEGTSITLTATAADGYIFTGWSNGETANPYTIEVTKDITLTANFDLKSYTITATAENGTVEGAGTYDHGANVTLTATPNFDYEFVRWTVGGEEVSTANPYTFQATADVEVIAEFQEVTATDQTLSGKFSTGKYEYAEFATGNLQYKKEGENETWRFAKQQYQVVGEQNINVGDPAFEGWIDMFGWSTNDAGNNFGVNPSMATAFYTGDFNDWGIKIGEGWLTLSHDQWDYLLNWRANASSLKQVAYVGTVFGIMLFPDNWTYPDGCEVEKTLNDDDADEYDFYSYNYTLAQWTKLEAAGAVFLPAAGRRFGGYGNTYNSNGEDTHSTIQVQHSTNGLACYWTSSKHTDGKRVSSLFNLLSIGEDKYKYGILNLGWYGYGNIGQSVRLAKVTDITPETYTRTVTAGKFGTLCLPFGGTFEGAELFECVGQETGKVYIASVTTLKAGVPYIFLATGTELAVYSDGTTAVTPGDHNGLHGTFDNETVVAEGNYILLNNELRPSDGTAKVNANRAYLVMSEVPGGAPQQMPGRRYIGMSVQGENEATGFENITAPEGQVLKTIVNGQLIIIRNGEKFNAQGQKL